MGTVGPAGEGKRPDSLASSAPVTLVGFATHAFMVMRRKRPVSGRIGLMILNGAQGDQLS